MNINELTVGQVLELTSLFGQKPEPKCPYKIGANYFIRTVTHHHTGKLVAVTPHELVIENAAWIADDGKFSAALQTCEFSEVEMFPAGSRVLVGRGSLIDAVEIATLPTATK